MNLLYHIDSIFINDVEMFKKLITLLLSLCHIIVLQDSII